MFGELKDLNTDVKVAMIPTVLNFNNNVVKQEFDYLFDSSNNYFRQSLYAPKGTVKAHWGEFVNLKVGTLVCDNIEGQFNGTDSGTSVPSGSHQETDYRFSWQNMNINSNDLTEKYAHDTGMIFTYVNSENPISIGDKVFEQSVSLRDELDALESTVESLAKNITIKTGDDEIFSDVVDEGGDDSYYGSMSEDNTVVENDERMRKIEERLKRIEEHLGITNDND